jgi:hypothetical protein
MADHGFRPRLMNSQDNPQSNTAGPQFQTAS